MSTIQYVGVDVAKSELVSLVTGQIRSFSQETEAISQWIKQLPPGAHVACEASGGYEQLLVASLHAAKVPVSVVPPGRVRAFARAKGLLAKTDAIDARVITAYAQACEPAAQAEVSAVQRELVALVRARQQWVECLAGDTNQSEHVVHALLAKQRQAYRDILDKHVLELEKAIRALLRKQPLLAQKAERIQQVKGVGEISAWTMLGEMPELGTMEPGEPAALLGVAPYHNESGRSRRPRHIAGGRAAARRVLYMAAVSASQHNATLRVFYQRLRANGKPAKLALTAVMRKLIELLNLMLKNPNFILAT